MQLRFRAFRAINDLSTCLKFKEEHGNVLRDYGIANITTNNSDWMHDPNIYCVIAEDVVENKITGGIRIQISADNAPLPVEKAIGKMDGRIFDLVKSYRCNGGVAELCALWNARSVAGAGVSMLLTRAGISVTNQLEIKTLMGICADYTLKMFQRVGFVVDYSLGVNGEFPYPNPTYKARVLGIMNAASLETAAEHDKVRMSAIRANPVQKTTEKVTSTEIQVDYNLLISK